MAEQIFRVEEQPLLKLAGLNRTYKVTPEPDPGMKTQWQEFLSDFGKIEGQVGFKAYGVCHAFHKDEMDYLCAVEVEDQGNVPNYLYALTVPKQQVAVFTHKGPIETISATWAKIFSTWLPEAKLAVADGPQYEVYGEDFDDGAGKVEIVIPISTLS